MRNKTIIRLLVQSCILLAYSAPPMAVDGAEAGISSRTLPLPSELSEGTRADASPFEPLFELLPPAHTGIDFVQPIETDHPRKYLYVGGYASPGIAIGDLNGDGLQDVFVTGGPVKNRLYLQTGDPSSVGSLHFRDATEEAEVDGRDDWGAGVTMVDIDNDGDLDIYVCNYDSPNKLFINETTSPESVRFVESAQEFGLDLVDASFVSAFCDYDLDGDLDVLVGGYQYVNPAGRPGKLPVVKQGERYMVLPEYQKYYGIVRGIGGGQVFTNVGRRDYLLENIAANSRDGRVRFKDVTKRAGIEGLGVGNSVLWWDYNGDGLPDIYIGNDFKVADQLYRNNGDGTFTDVIRDTFPHTTWFSMGSEAGDVNNDGLIDLFVTDMAGTTHYRSKVTMGEMSNNRDFLKSANPRQYMRNALLVNTGTPRFLEAAYMAGLANSDWSWAAKLADLDNDGWLDVFISNGAARMFNHSDRQITDQQRIGKTQWELWEDTPTRLEENLAFRNLGDLQFEDVSAKWGLKKKGMSYATAYGDLDNDGDLDLVVANLEEPVSVYRNRSREGHRLRVRLVGTRSNRSGLGAIVRIKTAQGQQMRQMMPTMGFMSCNEPIVHFGLGAEDRAAELSVSWPSGILQVFQDLKADQVYTITEPSIDAGPRLVENQVDAGTPMFLPSRVFPALRHVEKEFDDYARQPLLPYAHSQLGPGLAMGDVDDDGDLDFYLGRAKGTRRAVYDNLGKGRLGLKTLFESDSDYEDMGALFFDADRDGDRDLYVVSGGVECEPDDPILRDRLYLNDGAGKFTRARDTVLPDLRDSGSVVCAADYDRDGDLDLFLGGRVIPGKYPVTPNSRLLQNQSRPGAPLMADVTTSTAPELLETGLVTSAVWSDADGDGWADLLVTHEWGPVKYFRNEASPSGSTSARQLVDRTAEAHLRDRLGWWNGIAARDLDNDGDVDYVVTNFGLNTTYHASDEKPELLYYGNFDDSGKPQLLEAKYEEDKCFPRRGLSCSSEAMPFVREKMQTFHNFGLATLQDIYTEDKLSQSLRLSANTLESGVLINLGPTNETSSVPQFRFQPLPRLAQISPSFGVTIGDFDADGLPDCFLAQNFFSPQVETGRMDSGLSLVLRGRGVNDQGELQFEPVWPRQSGILVPGDAKACSLVDFNEDGWSDLLVTVNSGPIEAFEAQPHTANQLFRVKLIGAPGNLDCVGAVVTVQFEGNHPSQTCEVCAGGGYLSQSSSVLSFGCGESRPIHVQVRWPHGKTTMHAVDMGKKQIAIRQP